MTDTTPTPESPRVAVVTVNYNSGRYLADFLASTHEASTQPLLVVVADNASDDAGSAEAAVAAMGGSFVQVGQNLGYGGAVNRAVAVLPASVLEADGSVYPSARQVPSLRTGLGHALFANLWPQNPWTRAYHADDAYDVPRTAGWLSGSCLLVRRSLFDELRGFDERYFMYFEDVDLGHRITRAGWTNQYHPAARVVHVGAHSTRDSSARMRREHHRSAYRFLARKYDAWYLLPLRAVLAAALGLRARLHGRRP